MNITTSPTCSKSSAATTLRASLSMTSWPRCSASRSTEGLTLTRSLRPPVKTSIESSSLRSRKVPKPAGGWASRSTSSLSVMIWSRASRRVWASRSFCDVTAASDRWVSASRCSRPREWAGASREPAAEVGDLGLQEARPGSRSSSGAASTRARNRHPCSTSASPPCGCRPYPRARRTERGRPRCWSRLPTWLIAAVWSHAVSGRACGRCHRGLRSAGRPAGAGRCSRRRRHPGRAAASSAGGRSPGAIRRAVTRNAVWPIILCPGRTARPSTCQSRTSDSHGLRLGEAAVHAQRLHDARRAGWWWRRRRRRCRRGAARRRRRRRTPRAPACRG